MVTKYGVISDIHESSPDHVAAAIRFLRDQGVHKLVLNGDISGDVNTSHTPEWFLTKVLIAAAHSGLETYVIPGASEKMGYFSQVMQYFSERHPGIVDARRYGKIEFGDHDLLFIPGTDIPKGEGLSGCFFIGDLSPSDVGSSSGVTLDHEGHLYHFFNVNDLKGRVTRPDRTVVFSHIPPAFDNVESAVDAALFAIGSDGSTIFPGQYIEQKIRERYSARGASARDVIDMAARLGYTLKHENRGNQSLARFCDATGVRKFVSGHFHESAHRAHDKSVVPVVQGVPVGELFWNASYFDGGKMGILTVDGSMVSYANIDVKAL